MCFGERGAILSRRGATCYLNSAIQSLFMAPEFRAAVFQLPADELNVEVPELPEMDWCDGAPP
jgi:hypothetical protein